MDLFILILVVLLLLLGGGGWYRGRGRGHHLTGEDLVYPGVVGALSRNV